MILSRLLLATPFLLTMASALDIVVQKSSMICDNRPVKASFTLVCDDRNVCTLGRVESVEGSFIYEGLDQYFNVSYNDYFTMDATMNLGLAGVTIVRQKVVDKAQVPVCSAFTANDYNAYGDCPADGRYMFSSTYKFPAPESGFVEWASSGYQGDIVLDIYYGKNLVGRCEVGVETFVTGAYGKGMFSTAPSGRSGAIVVLAVASVLMFYILYRTINAYRAVLKARAPKKLTEKQPEDDLATEYSRMEAQEVLPERTVDIKSIDTRYMSDGPVI